MDRLNYIQKLVFICPPLYPIQVFKQITGKMLAEDTSKDQYQKNLNEQVKTVRGTKNEKDE